MSNTVATTATTLTPNVPVVVVPDKIYEIAALIKKDWKKVNYAAVPYLNAMFSLTTVEDNYINESGRSIILTFLGNARSWTGDTAKAVKKKLNSMVK